MITTAAAAAILGVSERRVRVLCTSRRIPGARLVGRVWMVPPDFTVMRGTRGPQGAAARRPSSAA